MFHPRLTLRINKIFLKIQHVGVVRQCDLHTIHGMQLDVHVGISFILSLVGGRLEITHCCLSNGKKEKVTTECSFDCILVRTEETFKVENLYLFWKLYFKNASNFTNRLYTTFEMTKEIDYIIANFIQFHL